MDFISKDSSSITFYDHRHGMRIVLTSTGEKTIQEADKELSELFRQKYLDKLLGKH